MNRRDLGILFQNFTPSDFKFRAPSDLLVLWECRLELSLVLYEYTSLLKTKYSR